MHLTTGATTVYSWYHRNRLVKVTDYASEADADLEQNSLQTVEHTYDAFNQWISRTVDPDGDSGTAAVEKTFFLYDQGQIVLQFDKTGTGDATTGDLTHRYLWSDAVDQLLADESATGDILWPLTDHLNTIRDLAEYNAATATTTIANHRTFNAFGKLTSETDPSFQTAFGFTGRIFESYTGLQNNLHRWYDFHTGRWISEDPIGFEAGDANFYRYVGNHVSNAIDPSGLVRLFGEEWVAPWDANAKGVWETTKSYGRATVRAVAGTAAGAASGAGTGTITGAAVGGGIGACAGGVGAVPGAAAGGAAGFTGGAFWGGISGFIAAAGADNAMDAAVSGGKSGALGGAFGGAGRAYGAVRNLAGAGGVIAGAAEGIFIAEKGSRIGWVMNGRVVVHSAPITSHAELGARVGLVCEGRAIAGAEAFTVGKEGGKLYVLGSLNFGGVLSQGDCTITHFPSRTSMR